MNCKKWEQISGSIWEFVGPGELRRRPIVPPAAVERRRVKMRGGPFRFFAVGEGVEIPDGEYPMGPYDTLQDAQDAIV